LLQRENPANDIHNDTNSDPNKLEFTNLGYKEILRTMAMPSLISELCSLRRCLDEAKKELAGSRSYENSPEFVEQKEVMVDKVLAVEMEIGRRLRIPKKIKSE
jgi:hypothetical protein